MIDNDYVKIRWKINIMKLGAVDDLTLEVPEIHKGNKLYFTVTDASVKVTKNCTFSEYKSEDYSLPSQPNSPYFAHLAWNNAGSSPAALHFKFREMVCLFRFKGCG